MHQQQLPARWSALKPDHSKLLPTAASICHCDSTAEVLLRKPTDMSHQHLTVAVYACCRLPLCLQLQADPKHSISGDQYLFIPGPGVCCSGSACILRGYLTAKSNHLHHQQLRHTAEMHQMIGV